MLRYYDFCCAQIKRINNALEKYVNNLMREIDMTTMQISALVKTDAAEQSLELLEHRFDVAQMAILGIVKRPGTKKAGRNQSFLIG